MDTTLTFRIRITKQLEVEPEEAEPEPVAGSEAESEPKSPGRRKSKRGRKEQPASTSEEMEGKVTTLCTMFLSKVLLLSEPMALHLFTEPHSNAPDCHWQHLTDKVAVCCFAQISGADLQPELKPLPDPNILMVEVENVPHDPFTVNEEVKVNLDGLHDLHTHTHIITSWSRLNRWMCGLCVSNTMHQAHVVMCAGVDSRDREDHQGHHLPQPPLQVSAHLQPGLSFSVTSSLSRFSALSVVFPQRTFHHSIKFKVEKKCF